MINKKLVLLFILIFFPIKSIALIEVDITRGNLNPLPIAVSPLSIDENSRKNFDGIIINAAAFTHTSVAIRDALSIFKKPIIELHISNIYKREEFRHKSLISDVVTGGIFGLGIDGYILAIISMQKLLKK